MALCRKKWRPFNVSSQNSDDKLQKLYLLLSLARHSSLYSSVFLIHFDCLVTQSPRRTMRRSTRQRVVQEDTSQDSREDGSTAPPLKQVYFILLYIQLCLLSEVSWTADTWMHLCIPIFLFPSSWVFDIELDSWHLQSWIHYFLSAPRVRWTHAGRGCGFCSISCLTQVGPTRLEYAASVLSHAGPVRLEWCRIPDTAELHMLTSRTG